MCSRVSRKFDPVKMSMAKGAGEPLLRQLLCGAFKAITTLVKLKNLYCWPQRVEPIWTSLTESVNRFLFFCGGIGGIDGPCVAEKHVNLTCYFLPGGASRGAESIGNTRLKQPRAGRAAAARSSPDLRGTAFPEFIMAARNRGLPW